MTELDCRYINVVEEVNYDSNTEIKNNVKCRESDLMKEYFQREGVGNLKTMLNATTSTSNG